MDASAISSTPTETLQAWRDEAIAARHEISIGRKTVSAAINGRQRQFQQADIPALDAWISTLTSVLAARSSGRSARARPIYPGLGF